MYIVHMYEEMAIISKIGKCIDGKNYGNVNVS